MLATLVYLVAVVLHVDYLRDHTIHLQKMSQRNKTKVVVGFSPETLKVCHN